MMQLIQDLTSMTQKTRVYRVPESDTCDRQLLACIFSSSALSMQMCSQQHCMSASAAVPFVASCANTIVAQATAMAIAATEAPMRSANHCDGFSVFGESLQADTAADVALTVTNDRVNQL